MHGVFCRVFSSSLNVLSEKNPVRGLSRLLLTWRRGSGGESCKCSSIRPRRFLQDSSLDLSPPNQVGRSRLEMILKLCPSSRSPVVEGPSHVCVPENKALWTHFNVGACLNLFDIVFENHILTTGGKKTTVPLWFGNAAPGPKWY